MLQKIKKKLTQINSIYNFINETNSDVKSPKVLLGKLLSDLNNKKTTVNTINEFEFQVFSQFGDDGIIQYLINHLPIKNKTFIEFGVENYQESNTRFLLVNNYWSGFVVDGSADNINQIKKDKSYCYYDLRANCNFITRENINDIMLESGFNSEVGLLSIDIDGNDYYIWKELSVLNPDIVICEYNSLFGFEYQISIPYNKDFVRNNSTYFSLYGTSLAALVALANSKGYFFIGSNSAGNNAYFINKKHKSLCAFPELTSKEGYRFSCFSESTNINGERHRGKEKIFALNNMEVYDILSGNCIKFDSELVFNSILFAGKLNGN